ncbi:uncharacterized protein IL334_007909 [Kwoniella shivajii]|uniref:Uncharacterized protein n=1 Tax=Kwoniella shivajii TaxID=564305 RepID=A0ABZ1DC32_9TREE|nr:hypothetical protein IL334_007909 [Kwoniella shivajii]
MRRASISETRRCNRASQEYGQQPDTQLDAVPSSLYYPSERRPSADLADGSYATPAYGAQGSHARREFVRYPPPAPDWEEDDYPVPSSPTRRRIVSTEPRSITDLAPRTHTTQRSIWKGNEQHSGLLASCKERWESIVVKYPKEMIPDVDDQNITIFLKPNYYGHDMLEKFEETITTCLTRDTRENHQLDYGSEKRLVQECLKQAIEIRKLRQEEDVREHIQRRSGSKYR